MCVYNIIYRENKVTGPLSVTLGPSPGTTVLGYLGGGNPGPKYNNTSWLRCSQYDKNIFTSLGSLILYIVTLMILTARSSNCTCKVELKTPQLLVTFTDLAPDQTLSSHVRKKGGGGKRKGSGDKAWPSIRGGCARSLIASRAP